MSLTVQFSVYGSTDVLSVVDVPPPTPGPGQVRLAVRAAGVNPIDWKILRGYMSQVMPLDLPAGLGSDVAGVVDQVGEGVTAFEVGDEVLGASITPSYAQSALADPAVLVAKPASVPWEVAGSLAGPGITAWEVLNKLKIAKGETLLVHAAAGGVGTFAVQLAVARGARVIGTASESNHEQLRSLGAEPVTYGEGLVDRVRAIAPQGVDAVLDASGRGEIPDSIELAGGPARVLTLVAFDAADTGIQVHMSVPGESGAQALRDILSLMEKGRLRVPIWRTFPLAEAADALQVSQAGHLGGKIVLLPA
ncbi:NADP-dependent oxidoreductase [Streptomyces sp. RLB3-17]|uniref:NADP-dependent oxidoreductase n=1 Tax=Streptomyces TaxID=1883 RepID=UPI001163A3AF|nr:MULTISPECIES: NADP-dependent oxidoreductase [unclassified Streptomyces]QDN82877.1 NADP-dependent oxidoreductase [Streptomyces sp. S1A1-7]QDO03282.1 NADP-dependent oxidoreductase [Streptomyces sp. RLB1-9]QDO25014.1 NADP-dependent oxidoreductase [Streptomyces sp. S1A1-8]QDO35135.1 NADP-dependent oxidoreductase [Streptomyces sp. S1A1-3]QDO45149.1 NADP-dependent oxidoreductase [Streptomyces sp. RLB3-17]